MSSNVVLKAFCIFLGFTSVLFCMWLITTYQMPKWETSVLPMVAFGTGTNNKTFVILDYNVFIEDTQDDYYIRNCLITKKHGFVDQAHAVVITSHKLAKKTSLPKLRKRWQRWVWLLDENPHHSTLNQPFTMKDFKNVYNWTMTYRTNSDVYIPYGWTHRKSEPEKTIPDLGKRNSLVAAVISNCNSGAVHNSRMEYLQTLRKTVPVTLYGQCGTRCGGYTHIIHSFCPELSKYLFYLAFENSNCKEYITEKPFVNGFESGAVPVVLGASKEDYKNITPPNSFIYVRDFKSPQQLGEYLKYLSNNRTAYMQYHEWRKEYTTSKRLQYVTRSVWDPLCDKLNNDNGVEKVISDLNALWTLSDCDDKVFW